MKPLSDLSEERKGRHLFHASPGLGLDNAR